LRFAPWHGRKKEETAIGLGMRGLEDKKAYEKAYEKAYKNLKRNKRILVSPSPARRPPHALSIHG
jgi:hypothetical protein